jgi:acyl dehydratase
VKSYLDFPVGTEFTSPRKTITETHVVLFAGISGDQYPLHVDEVYAQQTDFGRRIAHGPLVYAVAIGLIFESGALADAVIAFLGIDSLRHEAPCFIGDTIGVRATVLDARPTSDGTRGVVRMRYDVDADDERRLMTAELAFLMHGARVSATAGTA